MHETGWFLDPYGLHHARWFSDGTATELVRDGAVEVSEAPPTAEFRRPLVPVVDPEEGRVVVHEHGVLYEIGEAILSLPWPF